MTKRQLGFGIFYHHSDMYIFGLQFLRDTECVVFYQPLIFSAHHASITAVGGQNDCPRDFPFR